jgi:farnesyl diphosphate synthase
MLEFKPYLSAQAKFIESELAHIFETLTCPPRLKAAMRHGVMNGGKRLRPFLVLESAKLYDVPQIQALPAALALELIHCYSLIHDDLPAMDNDDLRRGQPTVHIAFDEATAILAGDALLTLAFEWVSQTPLLVKAFAKAAGAAGMVGGQILDIEAETRQLNAEEIITMQAMKTGALIKLACVSGAILAGQAMQPLETYGEKIGLAFQIADDRLDILSSAAILGKNTQKDAGKGKETLVGLKGLTWAQEKLTQLQQEAEAALFSFGEKAQCLKETARFIISRES